MISIKSQSDSINTFDDVNNFIPGINGLKAANNDLLTKIEAVEGTLSNYQINYKDVNGVLKMNELTENLNDAKENIKVIVNTLEKLKENHDTEDNVQTKPTQMEFSDEDNNHIETITNVTNLLESSIKTIIDEICRIERIIENIKNEDYNLRTEKLKPAYVVLFVNHIFEHDKDLPKLKDDIIEAKRIFKSDRGFELENNVSNYENLNKEDTSKKIIELKIKNYENYSSLIIIFNSHGGSDGKLTTSDSENINITDFYEACKENLNLTNKPIIMIFETCRGDGIDETSRIGLPTKAKFQRFHPERNNYLIVYATSDGNYALVADNEKGSRFLQTFFEIIEDHPDWDILAQLTKTTNDVLQKYEPRLTNKEQNPHHTPNIPYSQTVTFISLLPRQFRLSGEIIDNWDNMSTYKLGDKVHVLFKEDETTALFTQQKEHIIVAINKAGFIENCTETDDIHTTIIITLGIATDEQIHNMLPNLQQEYSYKNDNKCKLRGRPKVFLYLGPLDPTTKRRDKVAIKGYDVDNDRTRITENSDCLSYCDVAQDWCDAICKVIENSPGNSVGLVRLLTEAMRRPGALGSKHPPHIQSSLRHKLVLPGKKA